MKFFLEMKDKRINYLSFKIAKLNYKVIDYDEKNVNLISVNDILVVSPAHKWNQENFLNLPDNIIIFGGNIDKNLLDKKNIKYINLMNNEDFVLKNALYTAEGFLPDLIMNTSKSIFEQKILILGSGRVAKAVAYLLYKMGIDFDMSMRNEKECNYAKLISQNVFNIVHCKEFLKNYDVIINTIPETLFTIDDNNFFKEDGVVFELASKKCIDFESKLFKYIQCPALPAKFMPESAGNLVFEKIKQYLEGVSL